MKRPSFHRDTFFALLSTLCLAFRLVWSRIYLRADSAVLSVLALCVAVPVCCFSVCASVADWICGARRAPLTERTRGIFRAALAVCVIVLCVLIVQDGIRQGRFPALTWRLPACLCFGLAGVLFAPATCRAGKRLPRPDEQP